jgi:hypothetical protein
MTLIGIWKQLLNSSLACSSVKALLRRIEPITFTSEVEYTVLALALSWPALLVVTIKGDVWEDSNRVWLDVGDTGGWTGTKAGAVTVGSVVDKGDPIPVVERELDDSGGSCPSTLQMRASCLAQEWAWETGDEPKAAYTFVRDVMHIGPWMVGTSPVTRLTSGHSWMAPCPNKINLALMNFHWVLFARADVVLMTIGAFEWALMRMVSSLSWSIIHLCQSVRETLR